MESTTFVDVIHAAKTNALTLVMSIAAVICEFKGLYLKSVSVPKFALYVSVFT